MYCHGVQWLVGAAGFWPSRPSATGRSSEAQPAPGYRLPALAQDHTDPAHPYPDEIETYGGQPNKQAADLVTTFDPGRMIWNGYTGAARAGFSARRSKESWVCDSSMVKSSHPWSSGHRAI